MTADLYLRRTAGDGRSVITHHWVWDSARLVQSQQDEQRKLGEQGKGHQTITIATQDEFRAFAWPNHS
jgi:hypothetical protein